jgi:hypothetical protein
MIFLSFFNHWAMLLQAWFGLPVRWSKAGSSHRWTRWRCSTPRPPASGCAGSWSAATRPASSTGSGSSIAIMITAGQFAYMAKGILVDGFVGGGGEGWPGSMICNYRYRWGNGREWYGAFPDCRATGRRFCHKTQKRPAKCVYGTVYGVLFSPLRLKFVPDWPTISISSSQH